MKLFLIDGHALIFKMYYAFLGRPMVNSKGVDTSILFGFSKYLLELIQREQPTHLAVAFDPPGGTFRNKMYPEYKANRGETPQLVIDALQPLTDICKALKIPVLMVPGFEADDVIGSMAKRSFSEGFEVFMVTPDKDYGQLVQDGIFQYKPGKNGSDNEILGPAEICRKWKISSTSQVVDILAICGDASDNVPGVDGVGPVGAAKLLDRYHSLEGIYEHLGELTPRQQQLFEAARGHIALSKELVTIKTDIPLDIKAGDMLLDYRWNSDIDALCSLYEMRSLQKLIPEGRADTDPGEGKCFEPDFERVGAGALRQLALSCGSMALWFEDGVLTAAAGSGNKASVFSTEKPEELRPALEDEHIEKYCYSVKKQMNSLYPCGIELKGTLWDIELMHYLINPERSHLLDSLCEGYLGVNPESSDEGRREGLLFDEEGNCGSGSIHDRSLQTVCILALGQKLRHEIEGSTLGQLYLKIEEPLIGVLARMERNGVKVDVASLREFAGELRNRMLLKESEVREIAGNPGLNVSSPKQIGELIFEKLKLDPKEKKSARGAWPTDEETLQALSDKSPVIDAILDYRGTRKLLSTYIEPFPSYISPLDARVHTTFNQALTSTGRLSSSNPNLQNIPIRTEDGRQIRKAFVAENEGWVMMSADYSQIELRIMAHLSCDRHLVDAFREGIDVHAATAAKIFGVAIGDVSADQRRIAKTANFGILYGISAFGLASRLRCTRTEARKLIDDYFESFPSIKSFISDTLAAARECGYAETIFGRRRYLPDLNSHNANLRSFAERNAVNAPIQGSAADIIKLAMIGVDRRLREEGLLSRLVLQIHDELLLEVPAGEIDKVKTMLVSEMENVVKLSVPLTVECNYGKNWLEAH